MIKLIDKKTLTLSMGEWLAISIFLNDRIVKEFGHEPTKKELLDLVHKVEAASQSKTEDPEYGSNIKLLAAASANVAIRNAIVEYFELQEKLHESSNQTAHA